MSLSLGAEATLRSEGVSHARQTAAVVDGGGGGHIMNACFACESSADAM